MLGIVTSCSPAADSRDVGRWGMASVCLSSLIFAVPLLVLTAAWHASAGATKAPVAPAITSTSGLMIVGKSKTLRIVATGSPKPAITESGALPAA